MNLFHSARLKLTAFYFAILVVFCLFLTFGIRAFVDHEYDRSNVAQRRSAHNLFEQLYDPGAPRPIDQDFAAAQSQQSALTHTRLNHDILFVDFVMLAAGVAVSYWFAGWTLKPIEEAHEEQKRFTSDASHELRTPLASMQLENEVFLRQKHFTEGEARDQLKSNLEEVARLERLATNLLALNQYENETTLRKESVDMIEAVEQAVGRVESSKDAKKVSFEVQVAAGSARGDRESIIELIGILLDNAAKYGAKASEVIIEGQLEGETYVLKVKDNGPGISEEDLPHIFERLYRGDKARSSKVSGHGIGLSLAQKIAEANGATIEAANLPKHGAVFTIQLPLE